MPIPASYDENIQSPSKLVPEREMPPDPKRRRGPGGYGLVLCGPGRHHRALFSRTNASFG
jgi:hypothetical protein